MTSGYYNHPRECTPVCKVRAVSSPFERDRPPSWPCPHCQAAAGVACTTLTSRRRHLSTFGRFHPSRLEVA